MSSLRGHTLLITNDCHLDSWTKVVDNVMLTVPYGFYTFGSLLMKSIGQVSYGSLVLEPILSAF